MKAYCISHIKDVDGLGAAALVRAATGAEVHLSDYEDLMEDLRKVPDDIEDFYLSDLGSDNSNTSTFLDRMGELAARTKVTYIDHHFMSESTKKKLRKLGVRLVHDERECSSMLAYLTLRDALPQQGRLIALYGAVTDYMDNSFEGKKLMEQEDRQFVLLESTLLAFALGNKGTSDGFPDKVVNELAMMKSPHQIEGVPDFALRQLERVDALTGDVRLHGKRMGRLAYMVTTQYSTGNVSKLLIGAFGVPVGVALKEKTKGWYEVSLRGTSECRVHLGKTIDKISASLGGNGGGHKVAAGCRIPTTEMDEMLKMLAKKV